MTDFVTDIPVCSPPDLLDEVHGSAFLIDKPFAWSSFDVIRALRRILGIKKIGHAGTLDPRATGLLICLVGRSATRRMRAFMELPKVYEAVMRLGETTASYDAEMEVVDRGDWTTVTDDLLASTLKAFRGSIKQTPPMYSAIKVGGERLYKKARRGEEVARPPRSVHIHSLEIARREGQDVTFRVACSKGTYIRSLAHDIGQALGVGAHLTELRRTAIGGYHVDKAWTVEQLKQVAA